MCLLRLLHFLFTVIVIVKRDIDAESINAVTDQHKNLFNNRLVENVSTLCSIDCHRSTSIFPLVFVVICQLSLFSIAFSEWIRLYCVLRFFLFLHYKYPSAFSISSLSALCCCRHFFMFVCWSVWRRQLCCEKVTDLRRFSLAFS